MIEDIANGAALGEATIEDFRTSLRGSLLRAGDDEYDKARAVWNGMIDKRPALIVRCVGTEDVICAVQFARSNKLTVAVRGGGHSIAGFSTCDGGLLIDLSRLKGLMVDPERRVARAEPGVVWGEFDHETQAHGLATTGGLVSTTGIAGFTLGGGIGWLVRKHGLACDNLLSVDLVTADGRVLTASKEENPDLFWGVRGGGGNFGIVTSFEYELHPLSTVVGGLVAHPATKIAEVLGYYREFVTTAPDELTTMAAIATMPDGAKVIAIAACYAGPIEKGEEALRGLREFGPPVADHLGPIPYTALQTFFDATAPAGLHNYWKSDFINDLSDEAIATVVEHAGRIPSPLSQVHIHQLGGAMGRVSADATAYPTRDAHFVMNIIASWPPPTAGGADGDDEDQKQAGWARDFYSAMQPHFAGRAYINFLGSEAQEGQSRVRAAYGTNYERLAALKRKYDPTNCFHLNQNINPGP